MIGGTYPGGGTHRQRANRSGPVIAGIWNPAGHAPSHASVTGNPAGHKVSRLASNTLPHPFGYTESSTPATNTQPNEKEA